MSPARTVCVFGSINMDVVLRVADLPRAGETVMALGSTRHPGGKGANQAIAAARAGAAVRMIGSVGADADGEALLSTLRRDGVAVDTVRVVPGQPTGTAVVLVDEAGENQIVVVAGANAAAAGTGADGRVRLAQLEVPIAEVAAFLGDKAAEDIAILNAAPFKAEAAPLFALSDIVVVNEVELAAYAGQSAPPRSAQDAIDLARGLVRRAGQQVVVTRGRAGSVLVSVAEATGFAAPSATVVDTTGAGDCFCGYLAAGLAAGDPLATAIERAHRAAAVAVGRMGATASMPYAGEIG